MSIGALSLPFEELHDERVELCLSLAVGSVADAGDAVIELLAPIQRRYRELLDDPGELAALLRKGADKARAIASATLDRAYRAIGLLPR